MKELSLLLVSTDQIVFTLCVCVCVSITVLTILNFNYKYMKLSTVEHAQCLDG